MNYNLGKKFYKLRIESGLSQSKVANMLGITDGAISKWETGAAYPKTEHLQKLAKLYNTNIDNLLTEDINEKKITKIVITGGPCAGKTTALSWIQNKFTKDGYDIIFVPESATELINAGISPTSIPLLEFQKVIVKNQLAKEQTYEYAAKHLKSDKVLIVCDRGFMDNKAYINSSDFKFILNDMNLDASLLRDGYDAVFHLITAANGAEEYYTLENNTARSETVEQARELDKKLIKAWTGHPHLRVIDNNTDFENKIKKLINSISLFLGEPESYEIEKKFLIELPNIKKIASYVDIEKSEIIQTYLKTNEDELRIRARGENGSYTYYKTVKRTVTNLKRLELEERLSKLEYIKLLGESDPNFIQIIKDRYNFVYKNQYFEIDIYKQPLLSNQAILEIELLNEDDKIVLPKFIKVIKEVTDDKNYKNKELARIRKKS